MTDPTSSRHAFISYVREDSAKVDELEAALEAAGIDVWRDTKNLLPGDEWKLQIKSAIRSGSLAFIACFSSNSVARETSYQNEELVLAVEEFRLRPPGLQWMFPVRFDEVALPAYDLGAGRDLNSLNRTDLFGDGHSVQLIRLVTAISRITSPATPTSILGPTVNGPDVDRLKVLLRDPTADIQIEDLLAEAADKAVVRLTDTDLFPATRGNFESTMEQAKSFHDLILTYWETMKDLVDLYAVGGLFGSPQSMAAFKQATEMLAATVESSGSTFLTNVRQFPLLLVLYAAAIGGAARSNYWTLHAVGEKAVIRLATGGKVPVAARLNPRRVSDGYETTASVVSVSLEAGTELTEELVGSHFSGRVGKRFTPVSEILFTLLRPAFAKTIRDDDAYGEAFNDAEIILDALTTDFRIRDTNYFDALPGFGRYTWSARFSRQGREAEIAASLSAAGPASELIQAGLFGGDVNRANAAFSKLIDFVNDVRRSQH